MGEVACHVLRLDIPKNNSQKDHHCVFYDPGGDVLISWKIPCL